MAAPEVCGRCRTSLRLDADVFGPAWQHESDPAIPHIPVLGTLVDFAPVLRVAQEVPAARAVVEPVPVPSVPATPVEPSDPRVPNSVRLFLGKLGRASADAHTRVTYTKGPLVGSNGHVTRPDCEAIDVKIEIPGRAGWTATWRTDASGKWSNDGAWGACTNGQGFRSWSTTEILKEL